MARKEGSRKDGTSTSISYKFLLFLLPRHPQSLKESTFVQVWKERKEKMPPLRHQEKCNEMNAVYTSPPHRTVQRENSKSPSRPSLTSAIPDRADPLTSSTEYLLPTENPNVQLRISYWEAELMTRTGNAARRRRGVGMNRRSESVLPEDTEPRGMWAVVTRFFRGRSMGL